MSDWGTESLPRKKASAVRGTVELDCLFQIYRGKSASAARILSPNPIRRPLPCLLIKSFFYGLYTSSLTWSILNVVLSSLFSKIVALQQKKNKTDVERILSFDSIYYGYIQTCYKFVLEFVWNACCFYCRIHTRKRV